MNNFQMGSIHIAFEGVDEVTQHLRDEFSVLPNAEAAADIVCERVGSLSELGTFGARSGRVWVSESGYRVDMGNWSASVDFQQSVTRVRFVILNTGRRHRALKHSPIAIQRAANWNYLTVDEENAKGLVYDVLDQAIQLTQLKAGQTFAHCSAIEKDGAVTAIGGWGGVGKTSSVMSMVASGEYRFLSDDLGVIGADGSFYRSPKRMQIYPYNLVDLSAASNRLLESRSRADLLQWHSRSRVLGHKAVRRRVSAENFFGASSVAEQGTLHSYIHLERGDFDAPKVSDAHPADLAVRTSNVLLHELSPLTEVGAAAGGSGLLRRLQSETWRAQSETILTEALSNSQCYVLSIPEATQPNALSAIVRKLIP